MPIIRARAPVRCCDLGGWTDTRIVDEGRVLNVAVSLYTHVTLHVGASSEITIESCDTNDFEAVRDVRRREYNNVLDLCKAAIRRTGGHRAAAQECRTLRECAVRGKDALRTGDLNAFAEAMNDNWRAQKDLRPDITTPQVEELHARTMEAGAIGFKLNGAGGGGTASLL